MKFAFLLKKLSNWRFNIGPGFEFTFFDQFLKPAINTSYPFTSKYLRGTIRIDILVNYDITKHIQGLVSVPLSFISTYTTRETLNNPTLPDRLKSDWGNIKLGFLQEIRLKLGLGYLF